MISCTLLKPVVKRMGAYLITLFGASVESFSFFYYLQAVKNRERVEPSRPEALKRGLEFPSFFGSFLFFDFPLLHSGSIMSQRGRMDFTYETFALAQSFGRKLFNRGGWKEGILWGMFDAWVHSFFYIYTSHILL